jgi:hypothetical protein
MKIELDYIEMTPEEYRKEYPGTAPLPPNLDVTHLSAVAYAIYGKLATIWVNGQDFPRKRLKKELNLSDYKYRKYMKELLESPIVELVENDVTGEETLHLYDMPGAQYAEQSGKN